MDVLSIQRALSARGYDPGGLDGVWGRRSIAAARAFQAAHGLAADGVVGPLTLAVLFPPAAGSPPIQSPLPPWHLELQRRMGLHEVRDRSRLMAWLRLDGRTVGDPARIPWCGDCIETPIALTLPDEPLPVNPYLARNWLTFGRKLKEPAVGAIGVFWRGSRKGISGHVAEYIGERGDAYRIRGGNQSNAITDTWIAKERLLGWRWPSTYPLPTTGRVFVTASGTLSRNEA